MQKYFSVNDHLCLSGFFNNKTKKSEIISCFSHKESILSVRTGFKFRLHITLSSKLHPGLQ